MNSVRLDQRARTDWLLLAGFCTFLFFWGLNYFGLVGADEPRYAQVAREMFARHDWVTPTLGGKPWLEKPVFYYWQAILAYRIFGVSDWAARLPSAFDATLMVVAIYLFLRRFRPGFHLDGALMTASCTAVIGYARAASMDMPLAAAFTIALLGWHAWYESGRKAYLAGFYLCLGLGTLAKGPVAPVLASLIIAIFALCKRDIPLVWRTLWLPGILLFCVVALPWYVAVQVKNPEFFRIFILEHNLVRFGTNLYRHQQPFWYYVPVTLLGLLPWTVMVVAAVFKTTRSWWRGAKSQPQAPAEDQLDVFLVIWLLAPLMFFSFSQSKLPGYIVPAVPAGTLLVAEYIRRHIIDDRPAAPWLNVLHSLAAALPIIPALMIQYILLRHRVPWGKATMLASGVALVFAAGMGATLVSRLGLRMVRFVTLVPVVLVVAWVLRVGGPSLDATLSARPVATEIGRMETRALPTAVLGVSRETEYGLAFYRNQVISRYELGEIPPGEHLLVAVEGSQPQITKLTGDCRVSHLGNFGAQHLEYFWISPPGMGHRAGY